jgi:hypothetical protein
VLYAHLGDGQGIVEVAECVELPLFALDGHEELLDAFEGQLVALDQNPDGVGHELGGHLQDLVRKGGRQEDDLGLRWEVPVGDDKNLRVTTTKG